MKTQLEKTKKAKKSTVKVQPQEDSLDEEMKRENNQFILSMASKYDEEEDNEVKEIFSNNVSNSDNEEYEDEEEYDPDSIENYQQQYI
tara:strand:+ start:230 stop:493 length:264 start_codon:yes stop_codon:yes gene_type:complete